LIVCLARQTKAPSAVILSVANTTDVPNDAPPWVEIIIGEKGITKQRNRGLEAVLHRSDIILFYDDDFIPDQFSLTGIERLFTQYPHIVSATGTVLADGVKFGGIGFDTGFTLVREHEVAPPKALVVDEILWAYGCNMAFRTAAIQDLRFDENLLLHGWQEDMDYAARISKRGAVVKTNAFHGVHRGVNKGRSSGVPLGFAQIVNPAYLVRKGAMTYQKAATLMLRNFIANHSKILWPEPFIDRRGRAVGNWRGVQHLLSGRADPKDILRLL
jgi:GT2 family glycosyltransferase